MHSGLFMNGQMIDLVVNKFTNYSQMHRLPYSHNAYNFVVPTLCFVTSPHNTLIFDYHINMILHHIGVTATSIELHEENGYSQSSCGTSCQSVTNEHNETIVQCE